MVVVKRELVSAATEIPNLSFQRGFDSCRILPHTLEELDLETCSKEQLSNFYHERVESENEGALFREGVDTFVDELWNDLESRRVTFEDSDNLGKVKNIIY